MADGRACHDMTRKLRLSLSKARGTNGGTLLKTSRPLVVFVVEHRCNSTGCFDALLICPLRLCRGCSAVLSQMTREGKHDGNGRWKGAVFRRYLMSISLSANMLAATLCTFGSGESIAHLCYLSLVSKH
jgi:hypothetical protein